LSDDLARNVELSTKALSAKTHPQYDYVTAEWGRRWPAEEIWVARKHA
jgi:hypothetical protein